MQSHRPIKLAGLAFAMAFCTVMVSTPTNGQTYPGVKCPVNGRLQCQVRHAVKWREGQVYFSSRAAVDDFRSRNSPADVHKYLKPALILKANHQLVLTGQYTQRRCPITGNFTSDEFQIRIAGVKIYLHDAIAKKRLQEIESTLGRAKLVFADSTFAKTFSKTISRNKKEQPLRQPTVPGTNRPVSIADATDTSAKPAAKR